MKTQTASQDDLPVLAQFWREKRLLYMQLNAFAVQDVPPIQFYIQKLEVFLGSANQTLIVILNEQSQAVGYIALAMTEDRTEVIDLSLDLHRYYAGAGRMLVQSAVAWAQDHQVEHIYVNLKGRLPVEQAFWQSIGKSDGKDGVWIQ